MTRGHIRGENLEKENESRYKHGILTRHKDGSVEVFIPSRPIDRHAPPPDTQPVDKDGWSDEQILEREKENIDRSSRRARKSIRWHVRNNKHTHFVNLTYDPKKYDTNEKRFNRMKTVLKELKRKYGNFHYVLVPEFHTGGESHGLIHWHGVMDLSKFDLRRATNYHTGKPLHDTAGRELFNMNYWDSTGLSSVSEIGDTKKVANYITKYITKDIEKVVGKGQKKYWSSRGEKPAEKYLTEEEAFSYLENHKISFENERGKYIDVD